ncbi:MAG: arginine deiminase family protein [Vicinamibacterales bacterium]
MTAQSDVGRLVRVAMKHPRDAFVSQASIDSQWKSLNYHAPPHFLRACLEFDALVRLLEDNGTRVELLPQHAATGLDSIYVRDASLITDRGAVLCRMGKALRSGEPDAQATALSNLGVALAGRIEPPGTIEGGDLTWLDHRTLAVGLGYRTNAEGIRQLRELMADDIDELVVVPLPHWRGESDVMHLMSLISPVDHDLVCVYSPLLSVPFRNVLLDRGLTLVEVPHGEFDNMGTNVLAIAPRTAIVVKGNRDTRRALEQAGVQVLEYEGAEISVKGAGGPTCLTRPLMRERP